MKLLGFNKLKVKRLFFFCIAGMFFSVSFCFSFNLANRLERGLELGSRGRIKEAAVIFEEVKGEAFYSSAAESYLEVASDFFQGKIEERTATKIFKGYYHNQKHQWQEAVDTFSQAIRRAPSYTVSYLGRSVAYMYEAFYQTALLDLDKALQIEPDNWRAYFLKATLYRLRGSYQEALNNCNKAVELAPDYIEIYALRAVIYAAKDKYEKAIADYDKIISIDPRYFPAYFDKAVYCQQTGRISEAIEAYEQFIENAPPGYLTYVNQAKRNIEELKGQ